VSLNMNNTLYGEYDQLIFDVDTIIGFDNYNENLTFRFIDKDIY